MKVDAGTKISAIIREKPEAIDAIASINPHFKKLKNPILRKVMAPRVTIADAARIGKCAVEDILQKLSPLGFETAQPQEQDGETSEQKVHPSITAAIEAGKVQALDVREDIRQGDDPFKKIMSAITALPDGFALKIVNTFEPIPLIKLLGKKGYASFVQHITPEEVITYFLKTASGEVKASPEKAMANEAEDFDAAKAGFGAHLTEVDVRDLEMPLPMVTILNELEQLSENQALYVHHKKVPQYLLPELEERGYRYLIKEIEEGNVKLLIYQ